MIAHSCPRCGRIHRQGERCRAVRQYKQTDERKQRNKYVWANKSKEIRAKANYLCELCKVEGIFVYDNLEVHHIVPIKYAPERLLDNENLICLCQAHHKQADAGQIDAERLQEIAKAREELII